MFWSKRNFGFPSGVLGMATETFPAVRGELIPAPG
jgi:hypothetical protein